MSLKVLVHYQIQTLDITLHETYHPLSILFPKNVNPEATHRLYSVSVPTRHITFTAAPFQEARTSRRTSCIHQTTHSMAHQARSMIYKQFKFHSRLLSNAMFVTLPLPTYMLKFSRCPRSPHNYTGARTHCCSMVMQQGTARIHTCGMPSYFILATSAKPWQSHTHTHTHAPLHLHPPAHTPAQLPHDPPDKLPNPGRPPTSTQHAWPL